MSLMIIIKYLHRSAVGTVLNPGLGPRIYLPFGSKQANLSLTNRPACVYWGRKYHMLTVFIDFQQKAMGHEADRLA